LLQYKSALTWRRKAKYINGGVAQMARACGSYPQCRWFNSDRRYHYFGPLVKRLRHRPFTAVTGVRVPYGSPFRALSSAGGAPALQAGGHRFEPYSAHQIGLQTMFSNPIFIVWKRELSQTIKNIEFMRSARFSTFYPERQTVRNKADTLEIIL
jgi:hypothetical protein